MVNIYCYTWNLFLAPQGLADSTCGYHAIKNGNYMLKLLKSKNLNEKNYLHNIKKCTNFKNLQSKNFLENEIQKYQSYFNSHLLSRSNMKYIIKSNNMDPDIFIVYLEDKNNMFDKSDYHRVREIMNKKCYKICIIFFKKRIEIITHWVPIIFDKINNNVHMHILDSYDMTWWGDNDLNELVNRLYPNATVTCKNDYYEGNLYYVCYKSIELIVLILIIYLFLDGLIKKLKRN